MKAKLLGLNSTTVLPLVVLATLLGAQSQSNAENIIITSAYSVLQVIDTTSGEQQQVINPITASTTNMLNDVTQLATATANLQSFPNITVSASVTASDLQASALAELYYYFEVVGPSSVSVPLIIYASGEVSTPLVSGNGASVYLGGTALAHITCDAGGACTSGFSIAAPVNVTSDTVYEISVSVSVAANTTACGSTCSSDSQSGSVDPVITFGSDFDTDGFSLVFSPDVGNTATPLPAALPLFATGLGAMGLLGWRRKRKAAAIAT